MDPEIPFRGRPRQWFMAPLLAGVFLIALSILIVNYPMLLVYLIAAPFFIAGVLLVLFGLDLWRISRNWKEYLRVERWRRWTSYDDER